jgi:hypothetical protein
MEFCMRFIENGPDIPRELRQACDQGNVVFFCGAGVSQSARVPGFWKLTEKMINDLDPEPDSDIRKWFDNEHPHFPTPYADIYQAMQDEFGSEWVEYYLSKHLGSPRKPNTSNHELILKLSQNSANKPQVITTNIDPLFEKAWNEKPKLEIHQPPRLPDGNFSGLVYLHGKRKKPEPATERKNYIFSTSDFGRAYLSDAWATQFIKDLLYTGKSIVFVGYSADDPPVKYLLQALHASDQRHPLYAFADYDEKTAQELVRKSWSNKGVTVMPYPSEKKRTDHTALWKLIKRWTNKKRSPQRWNKLMQRLSQRFPANLKPYVRKLIVEWVDTPEGRKYFNEHKPTPPAEWICVFDPTLRRHEPVDLWNQKTGSIVFDPLSNYGLPEETHLKTRYNNPQEKRIQEQEWKQIEKEKEKDSRFNELTFWFCSHLDHPITAWWAAGQRKLPETLHNHIKWNLAPNSTFPQCPSARNIWRMLVHTSRNQTHGNPYNSFRKAYQSLHSPETDQYAYTQLQTLLTPIIKASRPSHIFASSFFPLNWDSPNRIAEFKIELPLHQSNLSRLNPSDINPTHQHRILRILCTTLEQAAPLLAQFPASEISWKIHDWPDTASLNNSAMKKIWMITCELYSQLVDTDPAIAKAEFDVWPKNEPFFFDKLRCVALESHVFAAQEVTNNLLDLYEAALANGNITGQWVRTLGKRWSDFSTTQKQNIETKICSAFSESPTQPKEESHREWLLSQNLWKQILSNRNIALSNETKAHLQQQLPEKLKEVDNTHQEDFSKLLDSMGIKKKPMLEDITLKEFEVLVKNDPLKALEWLEQAPHTNEVVPFWGTLAVHDRNQTRADDHHRKRIAEAFLSLPDTMQIRLSKCIPRWFKAHLPQHNNLEETFEWWDAYYKLLIHHPTPPNRNEWVSTRDPISQNSHWHLSQTPLFMMTECLLIKQPLKLTRQRIEELLQLDAPARQSVICALTLRMDTLYAQNTKWTIEHLVPYFSGQYAEAAWAGFLRDGAIEPEIPDSLSAHLKNALLEVAPEIQSWKWQSGSAIAFARLYIKMRSMIPYPKARQLLRYLGHEGRCEVISRIADEENFWTTALKPLIRNAWPKEKFCKSPELSAELAQAIMKIGPDFPEATKLISPYLSHTHQLSLYEETEIINQHPKQFLILLNRLTSDAPENRSWDLQELLDKVSSADSSLQNTLEWKRLKRIANAPM